MQTTLTSGMIQLLDKENGRDLINAAYKFRMAYRLTYEEAAYLIEKWQNIPEIKPNN